MANKVGRPRNKPQSADELRTAAVAALARSQQRFKDERVIPIEELKDKIDSLDTRKRYSSKEMSELRDVVALMYANFKAEQEEIQAQHEASTNAALRAVSIDAGIRGNKPITEAEWNRLHDRRADGSKKRGPKPKKKKLIWDLSPGERGNADGPAAPIDVDAMELAFETAMIEQAIEDRKAEPKYAVGKRLRSSSANTRPSVDQSRFYY